jgi:hypothetical protein
MKMQLELTERTTNVYIAKSPSIYANVDEIDFVKTRCHSASEIINNTFEAVNENQFTTVIPFIGDDIDERKDKYLAFSGCVQPIVLEFDHCPIDLQQKRVQFLNEKLNTPMFVVHSGNKSLHHYIFFKQFAKTKEEYTNRCKQFVSYLASAYPDYFKERESDKEQHPLVPDYKMFTGNRYARQANGRRQENGKLQEAHVLHNVDDGVEAMDLVKLVGDTTPANGFGATATKTNDADAVINKKPRKATLEFIAMGVDEGCRDDECYKAACDLRDCGYNKADTLTMLMEGANKCTPAFPESEVKVKVESAWNGGGYYDPIDKSKPYAFIERTTGAYWYLVGGKLHSAKKEVLKDIMKSYKTNVPDPFDVYEFKFDVNDNAQLDRANRTFNLFTPTKYHLMASNGVAINPDVDFPYINKLLCNLFVKHREKQHFLNWLACALQTRKKLMTAYVLKGEQGAGKGLLFSFIIKPLFGETQTMQVEDEQLKGQFNGYMKNVCFVAFNEVAHDNYSRNSLNSKIKSIITDPTIIVNEKFVKPYPIKNSVNCMFFSNEKVPLLVERSDRRFNIVETGGALTNHCWFDANVVLPMLSTELDSFAQYLWNIDIDIAKANKALENDTKTTLIQAGTNRYEEFAMRLRSADIEWFIDNINEDSYYDVQKKDLEPLKVNRISKKVALSLFNKLNPGDNVSTKNLTSKLRLYNIVDGRDCDKDRTRIYKW